jgi:D-glycero-D-manno-heptose 1,7-bisphosphate phosphatase
MALYCVESEAPDQGDEVVRKAVFLDRDGVLAVPKFRDGRSFAVRALAEFRLYDDAEPSVNALVDAGWTVVVATNQPDIANGLVSAGTVEAMHDIVRSRMPVASVETCPHNREANCDCRKPKPGLLVRAAERHGIDLAASYMVGDRDSDIEAGAAAGCRTIFIDRGYDRPAAIQPERTVASLAEAVAHILRRRDGTSASLAS